jgi:putative flippase GtrA
MKLEILPAAEPYAERRDAPDALRGLWRAALRLPVFMRYIFVAGVIGLPASILQLMALIWAYGGLTGHVGTIELNVLWLINFEMGLLRNFALHCLFTWNQRPTWSMTRHAHVAASGAIVIDLIAFNLVVFATGIIPLAQLAGATSGFAFNYTYNSLKTFARRLEVAGG